MPKQSTKDLIMQKMGRIPFSLFKYDDDFKSANNFDEVAALLSKKSNGEVQVSPQSLKRMILKGIQCNECKVSDFADWLKSEKKEGRRGKASYREKLEEFYGKSIWEVFTEKVSKSDSITDANNIITRDSGGKVKASDITFRKAIEKGVESNEIEKNSTWARWLPKKRVKKGRSDEVDAPSKWYSVRMDASCNSCRWSGKKLISFMIADLSCGMALRAVRCPACSRWASLTVEGDVRGVTIRKRCSTEEERSKNKSLPGELFLDKNGKIIKNPFT